MSIYYTPIALAKLSDGVVNSAVSDDVTNNMIEIAIQNAIQNTIVIPFQTWVLQTWIKFVGVSHYACLGIAMLGGIAYIIGIEEGKKVAIIATITYLGIQLLNWVFIGG